MNVAILIKNSVCAFFLLLTGILNAQTYIKPFIGANFGNRISTSELQERKDSLDKADKIRLFPAAGVHFLFENEPGREFFTGITYSEWGFVRERFNLQFGDTVHPDLIPIYDLSQGADKNVFYTHRYRFIEVPVGFNFQVTPRQYMNTFTGWFNVSLIPQFLIGQNMDMFLQGFSIKGKSRYKFEDTGYDPVKVNLALQSGGRVDYKLNNKTWVTFDAVLRMHLLNSASNSMEKLRFWNLGLQLGLRYEIHDN